MDAEDTKKQVKKLVRIWVATIIPLYIISGILNFLMPISDSDPILNGSTGLRLALLLITLVAFLIPLQIKITHYAKMAQMKKTRIFFFIFSFVYIWATALAVIVIIAEIIHR